MDIDGFKDLIARKAPPSGLAPALEALWWDAKGDWDKAHERAQADGGPAGAWVHAYLHRKEGDLGNARYWYGQARRNAAEGAAFEAEWEEIARALLNG